MKPGTRSAPAIFLALWFLALPTGSEAQTSVAEDPLRLGLQAGYPFVLTPDEGFDGVFAGGIDLEIPGLGPYVFPILSFGYARIDVEFDAQAQARIGPFRFDITVEAEGNVDIYTLGGGLRLRPLGPAPTGSPSPFLDLQGTYVHLEVDGDDGDEAGIRVGGGLDYGLTRSVALGARAEYARVFIDSDDLESLNLFATLAFLF